MLFQISNNVYSGTPPPLFVWNTFITINPEMIASPPCSSYKVDLETKCIDYLLAGAEIKEKNMMIKILRNWSNFISIYIKSYGKKPEQIIQYSYHMRMNG